MFVSHAHADTWVAKRIAEKIRKQGGLTFLDETDIATGEDFEERIMMEIGRSDEFLVLLTPWSLDRGYVLGEIGAAAAKRIPIIGVLYGLTAAEVQASPSLPSWIKRRNLVNINEIDRYLRELARRNAARCQERGGTHG